MRGSCARACLNAPPRRACGLKPGRGVVSHIADAPYLGQEAQGCAQGNQGCAPGERNSICMSPWQLAQRDASCEGHHCPPGPSARFDAGRQCHSPTSVRQERTLLGGPRVRCCRLPAEGTTGDGAGCWRLRTGVGVARGDWGPGDGRGKAAPALATSRNTSPAVCRLCRSDWDAVAPHSLPIRAPPSTPAVPHPRSRSSRPAPHANVCRLPASCHLEAHRQSGGPTATSLDAGRRLLGSTRAWLSPGC
jgi:hypothetical protein